MEKFSLFKAKGDPRRGKFGHVKPSGWTDIRMGEWHKRQAEQLGEEHKDYKYHMSRYKSKMKKEGIDTDMRWSKRLSFNLLKSRKMAKPKFTKKMKDFYYKRTEKHIGLVVKNMEKLAEKFDLKPKEMMDRAKAHDKSKYGGVEFEPYVWLTEFHRCKNCGEDFKYPKGVEKYVGRATKHHVEKNRHHPESHKDINSMSKLDIIEMVCDWTAMSQELGQNGGSARGWADKNVGTKWKFNDENKKFIYQVITDLDKANKSFFGFLDIVKAKGDPRRGKFGHIKPRDWTDTRMGEWHKRQVDNFGEEHKSYKYHMSRYEGLMKKEGINTDLRWSKKFSFDMSKSRTKGAKDKKKRKSSGIKKIPRDKIIANRDSLYAAYSNVSSGRKSKTNDVIQVQKVDDGYLITDGHHRFIKNLYHGDKEIKVDVSTGHNDTWVVPEKNKRFIHSNSKFSGMEDFDDEVDLKDALGHQKKKDTKKSKKSIMFNLDMFKSKPKIEVAAIAVINGTKILMGKRRDKGNKWTNPGGHIEGKEKPIDGAVRELKEETGIEVKSSKLTPMGFKDVTTLDNKKIRVHAFKLSYKGPTTMLEDPDEEVFRWQWLDINAMPKEVMGNLHAKKNILLEKLKAKVEVEKSIMSFFDIFKAKMRKKVYVKPSHGKKGFWRFQIVGHEDQAEASSSHGDTINIEDLLTNKRWTNVIKEQKQPVGQVWTTAAGDMYVVTGKDGDDWVVVKAENYGNKKAEEFVLDPSTIYRHLGDFKSVLEEARRIVFEVEKMGKSGKNHGTGSKTESMRTVINAFGFSRVPYGHLSDVPYSKPKGDKSNLVGFVAFGKARQDDQEILNEELRVSARVLTKMKVKLKTPLDFICQKKVSQRRTYGVYYPLGSIGRSPMIELKDTGERRQKTLMHEIGHAIDYAMEKHQPGKMGTFFGVNAAFSGNYERDKDLAKKYERVKEIVKSSPFYKKASGSYRSYLNNNTEIFARAFEVYAYDIMAEMVKKKEIPKVHLEGLTPDVLNNSAEASEKADKVYKQVYDKSDKSGELQKKRDALSKKFDDMREKKGYIGRIGQFLDDIPTAKKMWDQLNEMNGQLSKLRYDARSKAEAARKKEYDKLNGGLVKDADKVAKEISKLMAEIIQKVGINKSGFIEIDLRG